MKDSLTKHTLNLYEGDYRRLQDLYPEVGAGAVIRRLVRNFLERIDNDAKLPEINQDMNP